MSFDNSRFTFDPWKNYSGVVMEQGRVQLDADWNEWLAEQLRRTQAGTLDMLGHALVPATTPFAFQITPTTSAGADSVLIGTGRMYVDGLLAENHGLPAHAVWDPALAELSGSPQPPPAASTNPIDYTAQPFYDGVPIPAGDGPFLAYLDVWTRAVTWLEDASLIDVAVGVDSTARLQTVWQVRLMQVPQGSTWTCATPDSEISYPPQSTGRLTTGTVTNPLAGPCCLSSDTGYTGIENQFYRVEIHNPGVGIDPAGLNGATFKWSRDNASVETGVTAISNANNSLGDPSTALSVQSLGRDQVLGFKPGNWIEVLNDALELSGGPGEMCLIDSIDFAARTITLTAPLTSSSFTVGTPATASHTRIRRWDQNGKIYAADGVTVWYDLGAAGANGTIPVPAADTTLILESGITVTFTLEGASGQFNSGDFWTFAARTADGSLDAPLLSAPPRGIHHHYTKLSILTFPSSYTDCRTVGGGGGMPATPQECGCCTVTVGDGVESIGRFTSIQAAINSLPANGGEVCILPGRYFEYVVLEGLTDIVIRGCGWQTRIASPSFGTVIETAIPPGGVPTASLGPTPSGTGAPGAPSLSSGGFTANSGLAAIITIVGCQHIELISFAVEAADNEVGILMDRAELNATKPGAPPTPGSVPSSAPSAPTGASFSHPSEDSFNPYLFTGDKDVTLRELVITASTLPAILAIDVDLLEIDSNRIAMADVPSQWPAIQVSGHEIRIVHNWVGLQDADNADQWIPTSVADDLAAGITASGGTFGTNPGVADGTVVGAPGGIQIAGPASDVFVLENEIEGGSFNGVTLGSIATLGSDGTFTNATNGITIIKPDGCCPGGTLGFPVNTPGGSTVGKFGAGGRLINVQIKRNRIRDMGLCGIGPVAFFDLTQMLEVISITNLTIAENSLVDTLQMPFIGLAGVATPLGYGAICVPDVENLVINDNAISNFGPEPGSDACGIFILNAEVAAISRNHIVESRDWSAAAANSAKPAEGLCAGILVLLVTPPPFAALSSASAYGSTGSGLSAGSLSASTGAAAPAYQPGLPALRIEHNVVRTAFGRALEVAGYGPFSIVNNHFGSGGPLSYLAASGSTAIAATVLLLNLGRGLEFVGAAGGFAGLYGKSSYGGASFSSGSSAGAPNGTVLFTNNICQLEYRAGNTTALSSVFLGCLDHLLFSSNQCWIDGQQQSVTFDAVLIGATLQATSNRFQESSGSVVASGMTYGTLNATSLNISTYCLFIKGPAGGPIVNTNNLSMTPDEVCAVLAESM